MHTRHLENSTCVLDTPTCIPPSAIRDPRYLIPSPPLFSKTSNRATGRMCCPYLYTSTPSLALCRIHERIRARARPDRTAEFRHLHDPLNTRNSTCSAARDRARQNQVAKSLSSSSWCICKKTDWRVVVHLTFALSGLLRTIVNRSVLLAICWFGRGGWMG